MTSRCRWSIAAILARTWPNGCIGGYRRHFASISSNITGSTKRILDNKIQDTIHDILGGEGSIDGTPLRKSQELAEKLQKAEAITPQLLIQTLRQGEVVLFEDLLVQMTGLRTNLIRRLVFEPGGEGLAIACRAADITKPDFASIFLLSRSARPGDKVVDPNDASRVLNFFDRIVPKTARKVVERWHLDPNFLFALKQINEIKHTAAE